MASASTIPPQAVRPTESSSSLASEENNTDQWPSLNLEQGGDWEMVPSTDTIAVAGGIEVTTESAKEPVVTFCSSVLPESANPTRSKSILSSSGDPKSLNHSQSSPDLRRLSIAEEEDSEEESAVFVEDEFSLGTAPSMVSNPPSVWSVSSNNKMSFRDAILQKPTSATVAPSNATYESEESPPKQAQPKKFKPKFVVVKPSKAKRQTSMSRVRSMGNLRSLDHIQEEHDYYEEEILGETDAGDYYLLKAQGAVGHKNGKKIRPDEKKRLQMTMAKKSQQRQRQMQRG